MASTSQINDIGILLAAVGDPCGWTLDDPNLSKDGLESLVGKLPDDVGSDQQIVFARYLRLVFRSMVKMRREERDLAASDLGKPTTWLACEAKSFFDSNTKRRSVLEPRFRAMGPVIQSVLVSLATTDRENNYRHRKGESAAALNMRLSIRPSIQDIHRRLGGKVGKPRSTRAEPTWRQMVRALAVLWLDVTGRLPPYTVSSSDHHRDGSYWEGGPFADLCRDMAELVESALPEPLREPLPRLTRVIRSEREALRNEVANLS